MTTRYTCYQKRNLGQFAQVVVKGHGELHISQGDSNALVIETDPDLLERVVSRVRGDTLTLELGGGWVDKLGDALTTSLTRKPIRYDLCLRELTQLRLEGPVHVQADNLQSEHLELDLHGPSRVCIHNLRVEELKVNLPLGGEVELTGRAIQQEISLSGPGSYDAGELESQRASLKVRGIGRAVVRVSEDLDIDIRGLGSVEYIGSPRLNQRVTGPGMVSSVTGPMPPTPPSPGQRP